MLRTVLSNIKIVQNAIDADLALAATWVAATDLGDLDGKPFMDLSWDENPVTTQAGKKGMGLTAKLTTSSLEVDTATLETALKAMRGKNVSIMCTPTGDVSAANPIIIVNNFPLMFGGQVKLGDKSLIKITGEWDAYDESGIYQRLAADPA